MIKLFQEKCDFCRCEETVSEGNYIFEGETEVDNDGDIFPVPSFISNRRLAKKWFRSRNWRYYNKLVFCSQCYSKLKNGYVVLDRFNQFYDFEACSDVPDIDCVMTKQEALEFSQHKHNDESVTYYKALDTVSKFLNGEIKSDAVGFTKEHPNVTITLSGDWF
ncbi:hypothetical protein [Enterococcus sp. BWR-S5]|uniref:hypothetical protein n=1 Tax=Enterococcus sp. BWR-S5 TaxID=2787714 RepID=UPI0019244643|nr:hypothetical protein [Enterococcus sp. BWR-S5]MBL1227271.1 hypothetical protein [Enterococcus sp. BWR-S5]